MARTVRMPGPDGPSPGWLERSWRAPEPNPDPTPDPNPDPTPDPNPDPSRGDPGVPAPDRPDRGVPRPDQPDPGVPRPDRGHFSRPGRDIQPLF
ncbi:MAG TPA: hypothetical protein VM737_06025 [Gemmatimonadota bacterium]|nr:hypothetical protein [Gemmatimonadota bacterium]